MTFLPGPAIQSTSCKRPCLPLDESELARFNKGREIYQGLCASCHGKEGQGINMPEPQNHTMLAPSLAGSPRVNERNYRYLAEIILKGMTGPIDGITYGGVMAPYGGL
jgi:cytochrome c